MIRLLRKLEDILWPRGLKCLCCDELSEGSLLCPDCREALDMMRLDEPLGSDPMALSLYRYEGIARQLVHQLKYECVADAASVLADGISAAIRAMDLPQDIVLTWVTMPAMRRRKRGIDHGRLLCKAVAEKTGLPMRQMLIRCGRVHTQRGLKREERLKNLPGTLECPEQLSGPVLLIDDVMTTGATAAACRAILTEAGASSVYVLTATRATLKNQIG